MKALSSRFSVSRAVGNPQPSWIGTTHHIHFKVNLSFIENSTRQLKGKFAEIVIKLYFPFIHAVLESRLEYCIPLVLLKAAIIVIKVPHIAQNA